MVVTKRVRSMNLLLVGLVILGLFSVQSGTQAGAKPAGPFFLYLPLTGAQQTWQPGIFGVETNSLSPAQIADIERLNASWVRRFMVDWSQIEALRSDPPTYDWSSVDEAGLRAAAATKRMAPVVMIKFTPAWAQRYPGVRCGPPAAEHMAAFARFLQALVARYSQPPYNVRHWEIGNEVEIDYNLQDPNNIYGCWGNPDQPYNDGGYYAQMLKLAAPAMKAADPQAQILIGGLLLDCDPTHPPPGKRCRSSRYLEGILENGGGPYFDIVSYHVYAYYAPGLIWEDTPNWTARGGVFSGKLDYLRQLLAHYGLHKPLMLTEISLLCSEATPGCSPAGAEFKQLQADYIYWVYLRAWAEDLAGVFWYTLEDSGWRSSGLYSGGERKPAYYAYQTLAGLLQGAVLVGPVGQSAGLAGYEFRLPDRRRVWIVWAPDLAGHVLDLPPGATGLRDQFGAPLALSAQVTVLHPLIIEFGP